MESKVLIYGDKITNPLTGRSITVGGVLYNKLVMRRVFPNVGYRDPSILGNYTKENIEKWRDRIPDDMTLVKGKGRFKGKLVKRYKSGEYARLYAQEGRRLKDIKPVKKVKKFKKPKIKKRKRLPPKKKMIEPDTTTGMEDVSSEEDEKVIRTLTRIKKNNPSYFKNLLNRLAMTKTEVENEETEESEDESEGEIEDISEDEESESEIECESTGVEGTDVESTDYETQTETETETDYGDGLFDER